jgi:hypothetical protein
MQISLGFITILLLVLFPGLLFRRLYFYGVFSKQFNSELNLVSLIAVSSIPGIINLVAVFIFYDAFITPIDLGCVMDKFKDVVSPEFRAMKSDSTPIKDLIKVQLTPFIAFLYLSCFILGALSGRFIRISGLDTKFKLLRFKNYWFYLFNNQYTNFKKMKHLKVKNRKHLFTKADILIDSNSKTHLYSGIIVDYELKWNDSQSLSKVILQKAERYGIRDDKRTPIRIPGSLLIVDCSTMKNINLTFIYEESKGILKSKFPNYIEVVFGLLIIILIPFFIFQADSIELDFYKNYFNYKWYKQIVAYFFVIQVIGILNPFLKEKNEYKFINFKSFLVKIILIISIFLLLWIL